jgi:hypothetical protein
MNQKNRIAIATHIAYQYVKGVVAMHAVVGKANNTLVL